MALLFDIPEYTYRLFVTDLHEPRIAFYLTQENCFRRLPHPFRESETQGK